MDDYLAIREDAKERVLDMVAGQEYGLYEDAVEWASSA